MTENRFENSASVLCKAIKKLAENLDTLDNFESYLSHHFDTWLEKFASTPEDMSSEFQHFSEIEF